MASFRPFRGPRILRDMLQDPEQVVVLPGVYDGLTARLAIDAGHKALYMTGAGTTLSRVGWPDLGLATLDDMSRNAELIAGLNPVIPVVADADTGFGGTVMVAMTVARYARAGVAGLHIEDQTSEKRCGHLTGKTVVEPQIWLNKLQAAINARNDLQSEMLIIARTDSRQCEGMQAAIARLQKAVAIGVDAVFLEGLTSVDECRQICASMEETNTPVLLNLVPGGVTPLVTLEEAKHLGFRMVLYPGVAIQAVFKYAGEAYKQLCHNGKIEVASGVKQLYEMVGLQECIDIDTRAGATSYATI